MQREPSPEQVVVCRLIAWQGDKGYIFATIGTGDGDDVDAASDIGKGGGCNTVVPEIGVIAGSAQASAVGHDCSVVVETTCWQIGDGDGKREWGSWDRPGPVTLVTTDELQPFASVTVTV